MRTVRQTRARAISLTYSVPGTIVTILSILVHLTLSFYGLIGRITDYFGH